MFEPFDIHAGAGLTRGQWTALGREPIPGQGQATLGAIVIE